MTSIEGIMDNQRETADNIGEQDTNQQLIIKRNIEKIFIESGPLVIESRDVTGDVLIWSNATHGIWDTDKWDNDVTDLTAYSVVRVLNPNNIWREHFRNTQFKDTTYTSATWDTTNFRIDLTDGQLVQTKSIFLNSESVTKVKVMATESSTSNLDWYISINGGKSWFQVENNVETQVSNNEVRTKIDKASYGGGRIDINLTVAGTVTGSAYESYPNAGIAPTNAPIHPYILGGTIFDTDGSTGLANVYLRAYNETTRRYSCTVKPTSSTGRWLFDCRGFGDWNNGDYIKFTVIGGSGTDDQDLRVKALSHGTSRVTNLKVQYWT